MNERASLQTALEGRYLLEGELGRGGMGIVFLARDVALDRPVAIKLLPPALAAIPALRVRFLQEARTAARLAHPHIVPIHAVEEHERIVCFVMSYVAGETLAARVREQGPLAPAAVTRVVQEVAWALAYAHQHGVIHRDIKPENILLERGSGRALVTDFGIARIADQSPHTPQGDMMGTPRLVSPEQAAGEPVDGRSDLYSLGVTAFYALTGRYPFEGDSAGQILAQHLTLPAPPVATLRPDTPRALALAIDRCLAKSPEARFATGEELAGAVAVGEAANPTPRILQQLAREISALGVDVVSFSTLVVVALLTQLLTRDFLGMGYVYTLGLGTVLASVAIIRAASLGRLTGEATREGWTQEDLGTAMDREARAESQRSPAPASLRRQGLLFGLGLGTLLLFWLGPKRWGQDHAGLAVQALIELAALAGPVALGRWFGGALEAPRQGQPGLLSRFFLKFKAGMFFRILGRKTRPAAAPPPAENQPTEVLLAEQAREVMRALPPAEQERVAGAGDLLRRLERDALNLRGRLRDLDEAAAAVGGVVTPERRTVAEGIAGVRREAVERLAATISALETLRLELLRVRAGLAPADSLTGNLEALRELAARVDGALEANNT